MAEDESRGVKRAANELAAEQPASKRKSRWDTEGVPAPVPAAPVAAALPAVDMIAVAKANARAALERARLGLPPATAQGAPKAVAHASLILDAEGRLVDSASGKVVTDSRPQHTTVKVNKPATTATLNPYLAHAAVESEPAGARAARGRRGLHFLERGELSARAQQMRAQAAVDAVFAQPGASSAAAMPPSAVGAAGDGAGGDAAAAGGFGGGGVQLPASYLAAARAVVGASQLAPVPRVEWWDALLLKRGPLPAGSEQAGALAPQYDLGTDEAKVTAYVEHPVPLEPPAELAPPPAQPLPLTAKERKKLRTQRRQAQERAKQDQIRAGLAEPPPPKVKLSNIMRALGEQAVANPTEVEARVRAQVAEREAAHERRNADSKLSKEQRREKRLHKVAADLGAGVHVVVYKVSAIPTRQQLHKIELNATQLYLSGVCLLAQPATEPSFGSSAPAPVGACSSLVVVEGGAKAQRAYGKLMLRRIKWDEGWDEQREGGLGAGFAMPSKRPDCRLVWRGLVAAGYFKMFKIEQPRPLDAARKYFADRGVAHYWDAAAGFNVDGQGLADALEAEEDFLNESAQPQHGGKAPAPPGDAGRPKAMAVDEGGDDSD